LHSIGGRPRGIGGAIRDPRDERVDGGEERQQFLRLVGGQGEVGVGVVAAVAVEALAGVRERTLDPLAALELERARQRREQRGVGRMRGVDLEGDPLADRAEPGAAAPGLSGRRGLGEAEPLKPAEDVLDRLARQAAGPRELGRRDRPPEAAEHLPGRHRADVAEELRDGRLPGIEAGTVHGRSIRGAAARPVCPMNA